ncbi:MAG: dihydrolipoyl dehydrogenase [Rhabdochlamydiaceae bacterium]|nr:dihydrolipoyl dehydrogenase [Rhabdochlamydiaceae bacterium]
MYDLIVIGSGPGGYVAAIRAAQLGLKTACIEKTPSLGGTCLNVGCIPSKALLQSSELYWKMQTEGILHGIECSGLRLNFEQMMKRKEKVIAGFNEGIAGLFKKNKIDRFIGTGQLIDSNTLNVISGPSSQQLKSRHILLATGSEPIQLPFLPFDEKKIVSSTGALSLEKIPKKMIVIGAGIIGVELGSVYKRLGSEVIFVEFLDRICPTLDESLSKELQHALQKQGLVFHLSSKVISAEITPNQITLKIQMPDQSIQEMSADVILESIGRKPYTKGLGLENVGIIPDPRGFIPINGQFRTSIPHIFAIGDLVDGPMLAHKASEEGIAVAEIIAGQTPHIDYAAIPNVVYTFPEVASVGLTEAEAKANNIATNIGSFPFKANSRARCTAEEEGFVKMIADQKTDRVIGVHIIGPHASELIGECCIAIQKRMTALEIAHTPHAHPTLSEAVMEAALAVHKRALHK